jgi:aldehyde dehydrogenase (NAD+)
MSTATATLTEQALRLKQALQNLGIADRNPALHTGISAQSGQGDHILDSVSPATGKLIATIGTVSQDQFDQMVGTSHKAFSAWRMQPAPKRGEVVRQLGEAFRAHKEDLAIILACEMGKIYQEALGEVQEVIDICDFSVGLSRQLYGLSMHSERPGHRMYEQWQPLGVVGIISAFNFPVAVWAWNAMIAAVCGNSTLWKPSEKTPLVALACLNLIRPVLEANEVPAGVFGLVVGESGIGKNLSTDPRIALVSATGSTRMGHSVAETTARRLGRSLLELGGNNAIIITPAANLKLAIQATVFAAVGTAGQRCTTARRLIVHESIFDVVSEQLKTAYGQLQSRIGHPLDAHTLIGPLIDRRAVDAMQQTLHDVVAEGGKVLFGGEVLSEEGYESGTYVVPALVEAKNQYACVQRETFAPILYLIPYSTLAEAVAYNNGVPQGLSSSVFTDNLKEAEYFLSQAGSDCGIANVNIGPSGAEIGGAFGGEKETGGGRESGSDSWKAYMRRQTVTINYSEHLPLAQGIKFDL